MSSEADDTEEFDPNDVGFDAATDDRLAHLPESVRARAPDDEDAIAWEEDTLIQYDPETGKVQPRWVPLPGGDKQVCVRPINNVEAEQWLPESGNPLEMDDAQIVALLREFYEVPDLEGAGVETAADLEKFTAYGVDPLLGALLNASGMDQARAMFMSNTKLMDVIQGNSKDGS